MGRRRGGETERTDTDAAPRQWCHRKTSDCMKNISRLVLILVALLIVGGGVFLATWNIPAPLTSTEKVLPDDRFPH